jgi:hypothetical protein
MKIKNLFVLLVLGSLLAACGGSPTANPTTTLDEKPTDEAEAPTSQPQSTTVLSEVACTVVSEQTQETIPFAEVQPDDWVQGPAMASVTIMEYGDFQ